MLTSPTDIFTAYFTASQHYSAAVIPYALDLFAGLTLVEVVTVALTYIMNSDDLPELGWRIVRLLFTSGFAYWWIINSWTLGLTVLGSFNQLGVELTGQPSLAPIAFIHTATAIAKMLFASPSTGRLIPNIALAIAEFILADTIYVIFIIVAGVALFTVVAAYIILAGGTIIVAFLPCRFTSSLAEGYFTWLVKTGVVIFFFYLVLGIAEQFALDWQNTVTGVCNPTATMLPSPFLGAAPVPTPSTPCTPPIPTDVLLELLADAIVLAIIAAGVPFVAGAIVNHGVNAALEHFAAAKYLASSIARPILQGMGAVASQVRQAMHSQSQRTTLEQRMAAGAAASASMRSSQPTMPLTSPPTPPSGGWNGRPAGPPLAPAPSGSSGGGGAALEYYPGRPGARTKAEAVDITKLQKKR